MQNNTNSNRNINVGRDLILNNSTLNLGEISINPAQKAKISFDTFVAIVSRKYGFLEKMPLFVVEDIWQLLRDPLGTELKSNEIPILKLVVRYCCFVKKGWSDPEAPEASDSNYYYTLARNFLSNSALVNQRRMLSKIVMDEMMANLLKQ